MTQPNKHIRQKSGPAINIFGQKNGPAIAEPDVPLMAALYAGSWLGTKPLTFFKNKIWQL